MESNEVIIRYKIIKKEDNIAKNQYNIRIFGDEFVKNNKSKCKIIHQGKKLELQSFLEINKTELKIDETFEIKLKVIQNITNMRNMFSNCSSLLSLSNISNINTFKITNMSSLFASCKSLKYLPDISSWDTSNVKCMTDLFFECSSLVSLPDI